MNATVDILTWLDQRIAQQVEHQLAQRLQYWRGTVTDLIVGERERLVKALNAKLLDGETIASITKIVIDQAFDRVNAKLAELDRRFAACRLGDDDAPRSKH